MANILKDFLNRIMKREVPQTTEQCVCVTLKDCPYTFKNIKNCNYNKKNCLLIKDKKNQRKNNHTNLRICFYAFGGLILYILSSIAPYSKDFSFAYSDKVYMIVSGVSVSIIAGAILALIIDIPLRLKDYETSFINALASNSYLKQLDEERLTELRSNVTTQLHKANAPCMARGLIKIDQKICDLLRQPYYSRYRHNVICSPNNENDNLIVKKHIVDYKLINPYGINKDATEYIRLSNLILSDSLEEVQQNNNCAIRNMVISAIIDDKIEVEFKENVDFEFKSERINSNKEYYNTKIELDSKNKKPTDPQGIRVTFKDNIQIHMEYEIDVDFKDKCFTKRLQHPAKNFRLDYSCINMSDIKLHGQIFGTELKQSDFSIQNPTLTTISLEAFDWLLPDNGALVVMLNN